jgi:hypothetical protein
VLPSCAHSGPRPRCGGLNAPICSFPHAHAQGEHANRFLSALLAEVSRSPLDVSFVPTMCPRETSINGHEQALAPVNLCSINVL